MTIKELESRLISEPEIVLYTSDLIDLLRCEITVCGAKAVIARIAEPKPWTL